MRGITAHHHHHQQQHHLLVQAHPPWVLRTVMQPSSPPDAVGDVNPYDRWRQWALSVRTTTPTTTSRDNLITCRVDKRAMRHMIILEADETSSSPGSPSRPGVGESSRGNAPPPAFSSPPAPPPQDEPRQPPARVLLIHDPAVPRSPPNAATAYPSLDRDSTAEAAMDAVVMGFVGPEALQVRFKDLRISDAGTDAIHGDATGRDQKGGPGSIDAAQHRTGARGLGKDDKCDSRDPRPGPSTILRRDAGADAKEWGGSVQDMMPEGVDEDRRTVLPAPTTLQQMVGKRVCIVRRSEVVDAFHKGRAMEVVCPCCATSLIAPSDAGGSRMMIYCPECETIAPSTLCVER